MNSLYLVVGLGKTGLSVARYLHRKNKAFIAFDTRAQPPALAEFITHFPDIPVYLQDFPDHVEDQLTDIILSPGVPLDLPYLKKARQAGVAIYGDIECLAREISAPVIAITGTNGKSTVTTLVGEMAKKAGFKVAVAGNIGSCVLDLLEDDCSYDLWVLELSSFQLELTHSLKPSIATILNVSADHLDRHHTLDAYIQAKQRIYHKAKMILFNRQDQATFPVAVDEKDLQTTISFGQNTAQGSNWGLIKEKQTIHLAKGTERLLSIDSLLIKGIHNWMNALAASALAHSLGVSIEAIQTVLKTFAGLPHRCQWLRTLDGVEWINDSKGTNVGASLSAIHGIGGSISGKIVLIAGGQGKGADFKELTQALMDFVRSIVLIGEDANLIARALASVVPITHALTLEEAVAVAKTQAQPGDVVLLSPACASLDMFRDFNHRGEVFASCVNGL